jgi:hypothetical protein
MQLRIVEASTVGFMYVTASFNCRSTSLPEISTVTRTARSLEAQVWRIEASRSLK